MLCRDVLRRRISSPIPLSVNADRVANREALDAEIVPIFLASSREDMVEQLLGARIAYGRISTLDDVANHPQNRYVAVDTPTGPVRMLGPGALTQADTATFGPVPALGADTERLRKEFAPG